MTATATNGESWASGLPVSSDQVLHVACSVARADSLTGCSATTSRAGSARTTSAVGTGMSLPITRQKLGAELPPSCVASDSQSPVLSAVGESTTTKRAKLPS